MRTELLYWFKSLSSNQQLSIAVVLILAVTVISISILAYIASSGLAGGEDREPPVGARSSPTEAVQVATQAPSPMSKTQIQTSMPARQFTEADLEDVLLLAPTYPDDNECWLVRTFLELVALGANEERGLTEADSAFMLALFLTFQRYNARWTPEFFVQFADECGWDY